MAERVQLAANWAGGVSWADWVEKEEGRERREGGERREGPLPPSRAQERAGVPLHTPKSERAATVEALADLVNVVDTEAERATWVAWAVKSAVLAGSEVRQGMAYHDIDIATTENTL